MDSSLGFKVVSTGRADVKMDDEVASEDGASTGFEIQGSPPDRYHSRTSSTISVDTASFHTADGLESDYPREYSLIMSERGGNDLSSRLIQQGAQYFSANEGETDSEEDEERSTLRAEQYVTDPDQPKLALAEDSINPPPITEKHPPPQNEEHRGGEYRQGNHGANRPNERSPLLSSNQRKDDTTSCCTLL